MKRLIYRLSSMGDIILSQSALEVPFQGSTDWVIAQEFESLLIQRPKISRVWSFSRKTDGLRGWIQLNLKLIDENYDEVLDLHSSLRTRLARQIFFFVSLYRGKPFPRWKTLSKSRWRRMGYILFKNLWPKRWRPVQLREACAQLAGGKGSELPDFSSWKEKDFTRQSALFEGLDKKYLIQDCFAVMPASNWSGKEWGVDHFFQAIQKAPSAMLPVILGTEKDRASVALVEQLKATGLPHISLIGKMNLRETGRFLSQVRFLFSNDTGLSHLAEAVGTRVTAIYGPTTPDFGFSVSRADSHALHSGLWCAPCSKDGQLCFRPFNRFACMKNYSAETVVREMGEFSTGKGDSR